MLAKFQVLDNKMQLTCMLIFLRSHPNAIRQVKYVVVRHTLCKQLSSPQGPTHNKMDLMRAISPSSISRITITIACLVFFFLQSHQEMVKFFSNRTSVSTRFVNDVEMRLPKVVICLDEPFKADKFPMTVEEYLNLTYSQDEVIGKLWPNALQHGTIINVTDIATFWYGRCFVLELPKNWESTYRARLYALGKYKIYFVDHGQELCVINGLIHCDMTVEPIILGKSYHEVTVKAKKVVGEAR